MKISGLQKTTLVDYPGKVACTIFLHGCNFRCGFCYNPDLVINEAKGTFPENEVIYFLEQRKNKLDAVCITGGEPLLSIKKSFLKKIKELGFYIKIDTNGTDPDKLKELISDKFIDYVAMDIKGAKEDYEKITNSKVDIEKIEESIKIISSLNDYEFRTTIVNDFHTPEKIESIGKWLKKLTNKKPKKYFLQGFKNEGNFIDNKYKSEENTTEKFLNELKDNLLDYFEKVEVRW